MKYLRRIFGNMFFENHAVFARAISAEMTFVKKCICAGRKGAKGREKAGKRPEKSQ